MRLVSGGVAHVSGVVEDDLGERTMGLWKQHKKGLADLVASMLACRKCRIRRRNGNPFCRADDKSKERYISRLLGNGLINPVTVMGSFIPEIAGMAGDKGKTVILMMDQSKISDGFDARGGTGDSRGVEGEGGERQYRV